MTTQPRTPAGSPEGGQFAATAGTESTGVLAPPTTPRTRSIYRAHTILDAYGSEYLPGEEPPTVAKDVLTDLHHWADHHGVDLGAVFEAAQEAMFEELADEPSPVSQLPAQINYGDIDTYPLRRAPGPTPLPVTESYPPRSNW